ncbi:conserved hypothetical protein [Hyphomicrobiales bacterium]|nr:conserved hypothetical protein [Hyphomicrobiales bacterium]CAH1673441.1 conserved hypothetical protein [Hyphomicrobiales bacterium]
MNRLQFLHLNPDWNAEPNDPDLVVSPSVGALELSFRLNPFAFAAAPGERAILKFDQCCRWRWDETNDQMWFDGKGRFSDQAPRWGEFYEVMGYDRYASNLDWHIIGDDDPSARHFIFYFRDEAVECFAAEWSLTRHMPLSKP